VRCQAILRRTVALFPGAIDPARAEYWAGLRPATPSNVPYIGRSRYRNLFSTPDTARWAGRMPAARGKPSPTSSAAGGLSGLRLLLSADGTAPLIS